MLPKHITHFMVRFDGIGYAGKCEECTLPKLDRKMEEFRGAGMNGIIQLDQGLEAMESDFTLKEYNRQVPAKFGDCAVNAVRATFTAAGMTEENTCDVEQHQFIQHGRIKSLDFGGLKSGESAVLKVTLALSAFQYYIDGIPFIDIDVPHMIERTGGVDRMAKVREALGV